MPALQTPSPSRKEHDLEIRDIAAYVHGYQIDSDLAVCLVSPHLAR